jgi:UDP-N-acetylglucosamine 2-epimerase (non-hydrolysing)
MNRQITGRIAAYNFAPTPLSRKNLLVENVTEKSIFVTGNTVIDALHWVTKKLKSSAAMQTELAGVLGEAGYDVSRLENGKKLVLITGHRRENFGDGFISMCSAIKTLNEKYPDVDFVYPMHLNPNVRKPIAEVFGAVPPANMFFIEPLDYLPFVFLMEKSNLVLTDSGGIQEEAPGLGKPVLVMRDTTERPEALDAGTVKLVGTDFNRIVTEVSRLLDDPAYYDSMSKAVNPYGDGMACPRILDALR